MSRPRFEKGVGKGALDKGGYDELGLIRGA